MHKLLRGIAWICIPAMVTLLHCTTPMSAGGSSSETVVGKVVNSDGSPACSTFVTLYPADYNPVSDTSRAMVTSDTTDSNGAYTVNAPDSTRDYSIVATKPGSGTQAFVPAIILTGSSTRAPDAVLSVPGAISVAVPDSAGTSDAYVYIPGTGIVVFIKGSGMVMIEKVPAGVSLTVNYSTTVVPGVSGVLATGVEVASGDTAVIPFPQLRYSKKVYLNTTASGAGVAGDVKDFPVLIRLTSGTFDFSQTQAGGSDLRFSSAAGVPLAYEIEQWDSASGTAEAWVRTPVVRGNNNSQYIVMHWGASATAAASSNSSAVFDTATGFQGVWHCSGTGASTVFDATANRYHGTPYNMTAASAVAGAIGNARDFDGTTSYVAILNSASGKLDMPQNGEYSLSLWAYANMIDTIWHAIAGKGHEQYYLKLKCLGKGKATWEFVEFQDQKGWVYSEDSIPPAPGARQWVYLTGVRSGLKQYLYINGEMVSDSLPLMTGNYARSSGDNFTIGRHARQVTIPYGEGLCYFNGKIDEVRVMNSASDPDWIRLCYMNQKPDDALVVFR